MNFRQLEVLRTLLVTGSATAAAEAIGITQSGVSRLLQQLEEELDFELFVREKGRLIPKPEAHALSHDADNILSGLDRFSDLARDLRSGAVGPEVVRFGVPNSLSDQFVPAMLEGFTKDYPGVRFETFFDTSMSLTRKVEQRVIDFAFMRFEGQAPSSIEMEHVFTGSSVCVMHANHPLAGHDRITPKDLRNVPLILMGRHRPNRMRLDEIFHKAGIPQTIKIETHSNSSACAYAAHGLGVTIISSFFAKLSKHLPLVRRAFEPAHTQEFGIATSAGAPRSIPAEALIQTLKTHVKIWNEED